MSHPCQVTTGRFVTWGCARLRGRIPVPPRRLAAGIGFVLHDCPSRNWVCFACFGPAAPARATLAAVAHACPPLANWLFCIIGRTGGTGNLAALVAFCPYRNWLCFAEAQPAGGSCVRGGKMGSLCTIGRPRPKSVPNPRSEIRNREIGFVSHDGSTAASCFRHQTSHFRLLLFIRVPLLPAVLQESVQKNGLRHLPRSP